jgi:hypothetical protein
LPAITETDDALCLYAMQQVKEKTANRKYINRLEIDYLQIAIGVATLRTVI